MDADLGGGLIKQRIPRPGQGHSGGYRAIIVFRSEDRAIFLLGFAKNERDNIDDDELRAMKEAARDLLELSDEMIDKLVEKRSFMEIDCSGQAL